MTILRKNVENSKQKKDVNGHTVFVDTYSFCLDMSACPIPNNLH